MARTQKQIQVQRTVSMKNNQVPQKKSDKTE
jgi:hypothetical protein